MIKLIPVKEGVLLKDYNLYPYLAMAVRELTTEAETLIPKIKGRKIWMINSTSQGGGVAEMMPRVVSFLRQLGLECDWLVADTDKKDFFTLTKKIHNLIHGEGHTYISSAEKTLYEEVSRGNAEELLQYIKPEDIVVIHDPQPMGIAYYLPKDSEVKLIWRCHIGLDEHLPATTAAWEFLKPYAEEYHLSVFSAPEYIPGYLSGKSVVMHPSIDPLDHKNRDLTFHKIVGILCNSNLVTEYHPVLTPPFTEAVKRLQPDGSYHSPLRPSDPGLLFKPVVLQVSRWDRFKGFLPLLKGFQELKTNCSFYAENNDRHLRRLQLLELVLAGPDPEAVSDDPEGKEILKEIEHHYLSLPSSVQNNITILKLPMGSRKENELIVNALQRVATVVVQNSIREGFGLTVTEAMWKAKPVLGTHSCGIRQQIRDTIDGILIDDPSNPKSIATTLNHALSAPKDREVWSYNAQKRVLENFLIFSQIRMWLELFSVR